MAFLSMNFIMMINMLQVMEYYWSTDKSIGNKKIQNNMAKQSFSYSCKILTFLMRIMTFMIKSAKFVLLYSISVKYLVEILGNI